MEYTIKAFPTEYKGRTYRSRLEARWAAFFDLLGWDVEYEPMDLGAWSPDFLIRNFGGSDILVEVKPITQYSAETGKKMCSAALETGTAARLLLVGVSPEFGGPHAARIGWQVIDDDEKPTHWPAWLRWQPFAAKPAFRADVMCCQHYDPNNGTAFVEMCLGGEAYWLRENDHFYLDHTKGLWARATEAVQWKPRA